ncbi:hypothetical protein TUM20983_56600 [Mycobacterium antarcticum]|uniref:hypothetical protein n=1 Tax=Mycolicibacterium sp. TUM20983 TaxID=3023369 RepID=UPI0023A05F43|nr:hypothetical protein [Mycolicibacterium sp. TUM20983]GLP78550.1 hypothetical protein TUM20983_56600 [Mycolicibacterium sp. TUM20983]
MEASIRPWFTTGIALVGASAIALTPVSPMPAAPRALDVSSASAAVAREFQLTALDIPYILTLPIIRQNILNTIENWAVYLAGFGKAGVGALQSLLAIPGVTVEAIQEVLALNFVGAFDTVATAIRDSVIAVGQPLLDSIIWRNQKALLVQAALSAAVPQAYISVANGFLTAGNLVTTSLIVGTQDFVAALLALNISNILNAAIQGTQNFIVALGQGAGAIVGGIEAAQMGIAGALATTPPPFPAFATAATNVSTLSAFSAENTITLRSSNAAAFSEAPAEEESTGPTGEVPEVVPTPDPVESTASSPTDETKVVVPDVEKGTTVKSEVVKDTTPEVTTPADTTPTKPVKDVEKEPAAPSAEKVGAADKDSGANKDAGSDSKPASSNGDE